MAKTKISEYDSTAANNTDIDGVNLAEGCPPSGINNAIRESMAHLKDFQTGASGDNLTVGGNLNLQGELQLNGSAGTSGQYLTSQGSGSDPIWSTVTAFTSGMLMMWTTGTAPTGWLLCNGGAVSRTTYSALYAVIGTTFGVGDGSTTFNLPDYRDRMPIGAGTTYSIAGTGGATSASHVHATSGHTLTESEMPAHYHHIISDASSTDVSGSSSKYFSKQLNLGSGDQKYDAAYNTSPAPTLARSSTVGGGSSHSHGDTGSTSVSTLPPYIGIQFIIKT